MTAQVLDPAVDCAVVDLRLLRRERGLSAEDLAGRLGVTGASVHRWERRERLPGPHDVRGLSQALGVSTQLVVRFFDEARPPAPPSDGVRGPGLRPLRRALGLTGAQLAEIVRVPTHTVYNWEAGRVRIPLGAVDALADALDVEPARLTAVLRHAGPGAPSKPPPGPLATLRLDLGLSQVRVAAHLRVSRCSVQAWERGRQPPLHAIRSLARLYAVPTSRVAAACGLTFPRQLDVTTWRPGDLPDVLRVLREWSGLTQRELAQRCEVQTITVRSWEGGRYQPAVGPRERLERLHRLPPGALLAVYRDSGAVGS